MMAPVQRPAVEQPMSGFPAVWRLPSQNGREITLAAQAAPGSGKEFAMRTPIFGLSTTPVMDIKSELRQQLERDLLALVYRTH